MMSTRVGVLSVKGHIYLKGFSRWNVFEVPQERASRSVASAIWGNTARSFPIQCTMCMLNTHTYLCVCYKNSPIFLADCDYCNFCKYDLPIATSNIIYKRTQKRFWTYRGHKLANNTHFTYLKMHLHIGTCMNTLLPKTERHIRAPPDL